MLYCFRITIYMSVFCAIIIWDWNCDNFWMNSMRISNIKWRESYIGVYQKVMYISIFIPQPIFILIIVKIPAYNRFVTPFSISLIVYSY